MLVEQPLLERSGGGRGFDKEIVEVGEDAGALLSSVWYVRTAMGNPGLLFSGGCKGDTKNHN